MNELLFMLMTAAVLVEPNGPQFKPPPKPAEVHADGGIAI
jgi:hypothetical protein